MTFFGGIVRRDGRAVPDEWMSQLASARTEQLDKLPFDSDAVFLGSSGAWKRTPEGALILCDARLDARETLATEVALDPTDASDADLIAGTRDQSGETHAERLVGDFAIAVWNPALRRLSLYRSHLGTRALFYVTHGETFAFASSLRALLALPFVSRDLDDGAICRMLCFDGSGPADETFYAGVRRLPAGHRLDLGRDALSVAAMSPPWSIGARPPASVRLDAAETLRALLIDAIETRLRDGETIAVHLSGGLDSSAIACIAARRLKQQGRRLLALCSVLPTGHVGPESDERRYIDAVLAQEDNIDPVWIELPPDCDPFGALPRWLECLGEPTHSNVTHAEERLGEIGRAQGADVVLSGFGGDFFVSARGMPTAELHLWRGHLGKAVAELRRLQQSRGTPWLRLFGVHILRPLAGLRFRLLDRRAVDTGCADRRLVHAVEWREGRRPGSSVSHKARALPHQEMRFILEPGHLERVLPGIRQVFAESFGQDLRFPLLDTRLIAFILSLPEEELQHDGQPRGLMRRALAGICPEAVRLRTDKGPAFDPAIAAHCAQARPVLRQWAETAAPQCWDYVDRARFIAALDTIVASGRGGWLNQMFSIVLTGGRIAKFVDWHARGGDGMWH